MNCRDCSNFSRQAESWEMPHVFWYECAAKPFVENLKSFPFKNTDCEQFNQRKKRIPPLLSEGEE